MISPQKGLGDNMAENTLLLQMVFGSTSDNDKIMPGIKRATKDIPDLEIIVHYASADNTPQKVEQIGTKYAGTTVNGHLTGKPWISGAGLSNVLTGVLKQYAAFEDLNIGVPISGGKFPEASLLSTSEKPGYNPVFTVGYNNTFAAANIATRYVRTTPERLVVYNPLSPTHKRAQTAWEQAREMEHELNIFALDYSIGGKPQPNDCVLTIIDHCDQPVYAGVSLVDWVVRTGHGIQILVPCKNMEADLKEYYLLASGVLSNTTSTGLVSAGSYINAAQVAATIMRNDSALKRMARRKTERADALRNEPDVRVANGQVYTIK
jgi:phosphoribosylcarboxyaminoimidazole (NCAIR) mutase